MNVEEFLKLKNDYEKAMKKHGKQMFTSLVSEFFKNNPEIVNVGWTQYTPYFNDGDPCVFSVGDFYFQTKTEAEDEDAPDFESDMYEYESCGIKDKKLKASCQAFQSQMNSLGDDVFLTCFGDHSQIVISRPKNDGDEPIITVNEHEHD